MHSYFMTIPTETQIDKKYLIDIRMGFVKDLWDILKDEPEARDWIKNNARNSFEYLKKKLFKKDSSLPLGEKIRRLKTITSELDNDGYPLSFRNRLTFLEFLLAQILVSTQACERGVLFSNFYNVKQLLYFPSPAGETRLVRNEDEYESNSQFEYESGTYKFYGISGTDTNKFVELQKILDSVVKERRFKPEKELFEERMIQKEKELGRFSIEGLDTLHHDKRSEYYVFCDRNKIFSDKYASQQAEEINGLLNTKSTDPIWRQLILGFGDGSKSRSDISKDLRHMLNHTYIG